MDLTSGSTTSAAPTHQHSSSSTVTINEDDSEDSDHHNHHHNSTREAYARIERYDGSTLHDMGWTYYDDAESRNSQQSSSGYMTNGGSWLYSSI
jgi:hypothetical protein